MTAAEDAVKRDLGEHPLFAVPDVVAAIREMFFANSRVQVPALSPTVSANSS